MDPDALARSNHLFFYVDLTQRGLLTDTFLQLCCRGALEVAYRKKHPKYVPTDDEIQQLPFKCQNGEFGYLRFTNASARALVDAKVDALSLALEIPGSIGGELHDHCEFILDGKVRVSFKIVEYEGDSGYGCVRIRDPIECPEEISLGRKVEMNVVCSP